MVYKQIQQVIASAIHSFLPYTCVLCGDAGANKRDICNGCAAELPYITNACQHCGIALPSIESNNRSPADVSGEPFDIAQYGPVEPQTEGSLYPRQWMRGLEANNLLNNTICGACIKNPPLYHKAISLFRYEPPISWLIQGLKFNTKLQYGRVLSELMQAATMKYLENDDKVKPELIIPVPLHRNRIKTRGFNQALELAMPLAKSLGIPLDKKSVMRVIDTPPQSDLPADKRAANIRKAFQIVKPLPYKTIALVDDVMTTGATVNELAKVLIKNGAETVQVWTVARTHK